MRSSPSRPVELVGLRKRFGTVTAVDGVDLEVRDGEFFTLLGPSGSGKTTILRLVAGFEFPSAGRVVIGGRDVSMQSPAQRNVGVVFQHYALFPHMSAAHNIEYPLRMRRIARRDRRRAVEEALALVRLEGLGDKRPDQLSGGQQQRVALARAMVFGPRVLLMDEPLGALDRGLRLELGQELRRIHRETGVTVIYVTHDQEEALLLSDRIGVLREGKLLQAGDAAELFESPCNPFVARFLGECNLFPVGSLPEGSWVSDRPQAKDAVVMVRAEQMHLGEPVAGAVILQARVEDASYLGARMRIRCETASVGPVVVEIESKAAGSARRGDSVSLWFDPADAAFVPGDSDDLGTAALEADSMGGERVAVPEPSNAVSQLAG